MIANYLFHILHLLGLDEHSLAHPCRRPATRMWRMHWRAATGARADPDCAAQEAPQTQLPPSRDAAAAAPAWLWPLETRT